MAPEAPEVVLADGETSDVVTKPKSIKLPPMGDKPAEPKLRLNIGSGQQRMDPAEGWVNVDIEPLFKPEVVLDITDMSKPWPWPADSVDEIMISHVLEHIPPGDKFFWVLKEIYRVCKNDAIINVILPHPRHNVFLNDPTHYQAVTPDTLAMFSQEACAKMFEDKGGRLTPFWELNNVDFKMHGNLAMVLDPELPEEVAKSDQWRSHEKLFNNIVVEYRFQMKAVKPFVNQGRVPH